MKSFCALNLCLFPVFCKKIAYSTLPHLFQKRRSGVGCYAMIKCEGYASWNCIPLSRITSSFVYSE